jgi:Tfp pilus assembly pilus retraction ATPase PilT
VVRVRAPLEYLERYTGLWPVDTEDPARGIVSEKLLGKLVQNGKVDFACVRVGAKRFQVNAFRRRAGFRLDRHAFHPVRAAEFSLRAPRAAASRLHSHVTAETFVEVLHQDNRSIINQH